MTRPNRIREDHFLEAGRKAAESLEAWIVHPVRPSVPRGFTPLPGGR